MSLFVHIEQHYIYHIKSFFPILCLEYFLCQLKIQYFAILHSTPYLPLPSSLFFFIYWKLFLYLLPVQSGENR